MDMNDNRENRDNRGEYNPPPMPEYQYEPPKPTKTLGIISLVTGIFSMVGLCCCCGPISGIVAIVCGVLQIQKTPDDKGFSIAGIVTGLLGIIITIIVFVIFVIFVAYQDPAEYMEIYNRLESI